MERRYRARKKKTKYKNRKTELRGITFDSAGEARRYLELSQRERDGLITDLQLQVKIPLMGFDGQQLKAQNGRRLNYVAYFTYFENGRYIVEDFKGVETAEYKLKRSILAAQGIKIREVKA